MNGKECFRCGISLKNKQRRWCSDKCKNARLGVFIECTVCQKTYKRKLSSRYCSDECRKIKTIPRIREQEFLANLRKFGISKDRYDEILNNQDGKCAICHCAETVKLNGKVKRLAIDHCHQTNFVRGLLCSRCNVAIGNFNDNWVLLDNALEYLIAGDLKAGTNQRMGNRNDNA